ncbi:hypothetical protein LUZ63_006213 [Rhynchospora breviuscula]|uniref:Peroxidase n=1 Tax=Rhynchospora breviuscula TaxID=2022672 RepID=A0A9Q0CPD1_9POAL|nr:hypothetical protein LUZ63_006213 [Rhynchospora breviuscula]
MESKISILVTCLTFATAFQLLLPLSEASLKVGFYKKTCPRAESIVKSTVRSFVRKNSGLGAGLIRMFFHDCFVRGCDASVLLDPSPANPDPEKNSIPNNPSLRGYEVVDAAKAALEKECPGVVSCADIIALAARDASFLLGKISYKIPTGRRDGKVSNNAEVLQFLPAPFFNLSQLEASFAIKGLSTADMVALSGAHSIGRSHCSSFTSRLYPNIDWTMSQRFGFFLRRLCPQNATVDGVVPQNFFKPNRLSAQYYFNVESLIALFFSDWTLLTSQKTAQQVDAYTKVPGLFEADFAKAMVNLGNVEVLTWPKGEIRGPTCRL